MIFENLQFCCIEWNLSENREILWGGKFWKGQIYILRWVMYVKILAWTSQASNAILQHHQPTPTNPNQWEDLNAMAQLKITILNLKRSKICIKGWSFEERLISLKKIVNFSSNLVFDKIMLQSYSWIRM